VKSEVTQEEIEQACHNTNVLDFVDSLPEFMFAVIVGMLTHLIIKFVLVLILMLVAKSHSYLAVRNVHSEDYW
jgi:hypothetical protein